MGQGKNDEIKQLMLTTIGSRRVGKTTIVKSLIESMSENIEKPTLVDVYKKIQNCMEQK